MNAQPRRVENIATDRGVIPQYATGVVEQPWSNYSAADHQVWATLFQRQRELLPGRACSAFLDAQHALGMTPDAIPRFDQLNRHLRAASDWELIGVEGLLPEAVFFEHLARRRFPVTWWIRRADQLDYIAEPDLFHDLFGHVPLLMNPVFADYMQAYGQGGLRAQREFSDEALLNLTRLYWYTVEFGLMREPAGLRIYGAGIVSSKGESIYSLESPAPNRIGFELERVMRTRYRIDSYQKTYFVIDGFEQLFAATQQDFAPIYPRVVGAPAIPAGAVQEDSDTVLHRGSREGWAEGADA